GFSPGACARPRPTPLRFGILLMVATVCTHTVLPTCWICPFCGFYMLLEICNLIPSKKKRNMQFDKTPPPV
uniref:Uncharacterized protein n=1 Tax=Aegilops tauschii subsp. strangulata TaxID=200361 RepID=A0A453R483_AEGTS